MSTLQRPVQIAGHQVLVTASIGIAFSLPDRDEPERLLRNADQALYLAKAQGKACSAVFEETLETSPIHAAA